LQKKERKFWSTDHKRGGRNPSQGRGFPVGGFAENRGGIRTDARRAEKKTLGGPFKKRKTTKSKRSRSPRGKKKNMT